MIMLQTDLFGFAYVPEWYRHFYDLKCMALPEAWQFKKPVVETKNLETPILERYIYILFFANRLLNLIRNWKRRKHQSIFMQKMNTLAFIHACTQNLIRNEKVWFQVFLCFRCFCRADFLSRINDCTQYKTGHLSVSKSRIFLEILPCGICRIMV